MDFTSRIQFIKKVIDLKYQIKKLLTKYKNIFVKIQETIEN